MSTPPRREPGLSPRWTLILFAGVVMGLLFGALSLIQFGLPAAILTGFTAAAATVKGLHEIVDSEPPPQS